MKNPSPKFLTLMVTTSDHWSELMENNLSANELWSLVDEDYNETIEGAKVAAKQLMIAGCNCHCLAHVYKGHLPPVCLIVLVPNESFFFVLSKDSVPKVNSYYLQIVPALQHNPSFHFTFNSNQISK